MFSFNFGRPLENYRDKFEEMVRRTLGEFFEVKSVTFQSEDVQSRADAEYGWRRTPMPTSSSPPRMPRSTSSHRSGLTSTSSTPPAM